MLTYWTTNMGEVTSYCFMMNSSASAELSDNRKGLKDSFYFKKHVPATSRKKKCWWKICGLWKRHRIVQSFLQGAGPKGIRLLILFVHSRQSSTCVSHDAWCENCSNVFLSKEKNLKTWKRNYCIFCPCDEEASRYWVKMAHLVRNFI